MASIAQRFKAYITQNSTATASDIAEGKSAYGADGQITGTKIDPFNSDVLVHWPAGRGEAGAFTPVASDMYLGEGASFVSATGSDVFNRDGNGWCYNTAAATVQWNLPAIPTGAYREYSWRVLTWGWPFQYASSLLRFNYLNSTNFWYVRLMGKGTINTWSAELLSNIATVETSRSFKDFSTTYLPNVGTVVSFVVRDCGDLISCTALANNINDATTVNHSDGWIGEYYAASRPLSSETGVQWAFPYGTNFHGLYDLTIRDLRDHT